jgi:lysophospholipase L1-like esterase
MHGFAPAFDFSENRLWRKSGVVKFLQDNFPVKKGDWHQLNYQSLSAVSSYCERHRIPLALMWLPWGSRTENNTRELMGLSETEFQTAIQRFARENHARLIDVHDEDDESCFNDDIHLNVKGAIKVSQRIAAVLTPGASGSSSATQEK